MNFEMIFDCFPELCSDELVLKVTTKGFPIAKTKIVMGPYFPAFFVYKNKMALFPEQSHFL
jgi:hypothetical protein